MPLACVPISDGMPGDDKKIPAAALAGHAEREPVNLKELAAHLDLSPTTLSLVLNNSPKAASIPAATKKRIFAAATKMNYRPNYLARSLRASRTRTIGVIVPELSDGYSAMVLSGVEAALTNDGYFYLTASHLHRDDLLASRTRMLIERLVEGIIAVDTPIRFDRALPVVSVSGHEKLEGVTNVELNHAHAADLGIGHLYDLGHRQIAVIKGQEFSSDSDERLSTILEAASTRGIPIHPGLICQLIGDSPSPELGFNATREILSTGVKFTALFAFNDVSAIGAIRALEEAGRRVPADVSVLGFDDIYGAAYHNPPLTTIRQPLFEMGSLAASTLLNRLVNRDDDAPQVLSVEPTLIVRHSTATVAGP